MSDETHIDEPSAAELQSLQAAFNARYPRTRRRGSNRAAVRRAIARAQTELWMRDVVTFAAAGITRWLLALVAIVARPPAVQAAGSRNLRPRAEPDNSG